MKRIEPSGLACVGFAVSLALAIAGCSGGGGGGGGGSDDESAPLAPGTIVGFAGQGSPGIEGDGGPAAEAFFSFPLGVTTDSAGNVFIADTANQRIRKID